MARHWRVVRRGRAPALRRRGHVTRPRPDPAPAGRLPSRAARFRVFATGSLAWAVPSQRFGAPFRVFGTGQAEKAVANKRLKETLANHGRAMPPPPDSQL